MVDNGTGLPPLGTELFTLNNSGDIIVRVSGDGGATCQRGMAIDVALAPNNSVINLLGGGNIYGNIDIQARRHDQCRRRRRRTSTASSTQSSCRSAECTTTLDSGLFGEGTLNITTDGNLVLLDPRITATRPTCMTARPMCSSTPTTRRPAERSPTTCSRRLAAMQPVGTYPQIFANTANIDGNLVANITTPNGLFADSYFWDNVIDANALNGTFASCTLGAPFDDHTAARLRLHLRRAR